MDLRRLVALACLIGACVCLVFATSDNGRATPPQKDANCTKQACNKQPASKVHPKCPLDENKNLNEDCLFTDSAGDLIWCSYSESKMCEVKSPVESNKCEGFCRNNSAYSCEGTAYNKCVLP